MQLISTVKFFVLYCLIVNSHILTSVNKINMDSLRYKKRFSSSSSNLNQKSNNNKRIITKKSSKNLVKHRKRDETTISTSPPNDIIKIEINQVDKLSEDVPKNCVRIWNDIYFQSEYKDHCNSQIDSSLYIDKLASFIVGKEINLFVTYDYVRLKYYSNNYFKKYLIV